MCFQASGIGRLFGSFGVPGVYRDRDGDAVRHLQTNT